jgi:ERCC4-related helicase
LEFHSRLEKAERERKRLEESLLPYVIRVPREKTNRIQVKEPPIGTPENFRWLYLAIRRWMTDVALQQTDRSRKSPFITTALSMATSSFNAADQYIRKHTPRKSHNRHYDLVKRLLGNQPLSGHPKQARMEEIIGGQFADIDVHKLAQQKFVIFVKWRETAKALRSSHGNARAIADAIETKIGQVLDHKLHELKITETTFNTLYRHALREKAESLMGAFPFALDGRSIWAEHYEPNMQFKWYERFVKQESPEVPKSKKGRSLRESFLRNIQLKFDELLHRLEVVQALRSEDGISIPSDIEREVNTKLKRVESHLDELTKEYFGMDEKPDQSPRWLLYQLSQLVYNLSPRKVVEALVGDVDYPTRLQMIDAFNLDLYPLILVTSSVGEEGIDLQKRCDNVVHYDLEWNPAIVEQREGRVDRKGRTSDSKVQVRTLVLEGTFDERIQRRCGTRRLWMDLYLCKDRREFEKETQAGILIENEYARSEAEPLAKFLTPLVLDLRPSKKVWDGPE